VTPRLVIAAGCALVFALIFLVVSPAGHPVDLDLAVATWIASHRSPGGIALFRAISFCGAVQVMVPVTVIVAAYVGWRGGRRPVLWLALTAIGAISLYLAVNVPIARPRPALGLRLFDDDSPWSFPSGHAAESIAFWTMTAILVTADRARQARVAALIAAALIAGLTGFSRIYVCAHWTTDVTAGFALGASWLAIVFALRRRFDLVAEIGVPVEVQVARSPSSK
jgi:undecaprenyl-diphosphatase